MKHNNTITMGNDERAMKEMEHVFTVRSGCHDTTVQVTERYAFKEGIKNFSVLLHMNLITTFCEKKNSENETFQKALQ